MSARKNHSRVAGYLNRNLDKVEPRYVPLSVDSGPFALGTDIDVTPSFPTDLVNGGDLSILGLQTPTLIQTPQVQVTPVVLSTSSTPLVVVIPSTTSTTPTTTTSSTTSTTSTTSSTSSVVQPTVIAEPSTTVKDTTIVSTITPTRASTSASRASASTSELPNSEKGISTGVAVGGGIAAAAAGIAVIIAIFFFIRRSRKKSDYSDDDGPFNPHDFRRSAVILNDDEYKPRPPTMIQARIGAASPAPTFGTKYGAPPPDGYLENGPAYTYNNTSMNGGFAGYNNNVDDGYANQAHLMRSPSTATSAHPMMHNFEQNAPYSAPGTPVSYAVQPTQYANLTRQPSAEEYHQAQQAQMLSRQPSTVSMQQQQPQYDNNGEYADLSRSSVTPFQAAQYAEISRRLNTDVPHGLSTPAIQDAAGEKKTTLAMVGEEEDEEKPPMLPSKEDSSPFNEVVTPATPIYGQEFSFPPFAPAPVPASTSEAQAGEHQDEELVPPTIGTHKRIDSQPPTLPEIHLTSRDSYDFPASVRDSTSTSTTVSPTPVDGLAVQGQKFTMTPSPLASSFGGAVPDTPASEKTFVGDAPEKTTKARPETVYDPEDAYGGI